MCGLWANATMNGNAMMAADLVYTLVQASSESHFMGKAFYHIEICVRYVFTNKILPKRITCELAIHLEILLLTESVLCYFGIM